LQSANLPELKDVAQSRQVSTPANPLSTPCLIISLAIVLAKEDEVHLHTTETKTVHF
jgi:hypothetical protein